MLPATPTETIIVLAATVLGTICIGALISFAFTSIGEGEGEVLLFAATLIALIILSIENLYLTLTGALLAITLSIPWIRLIRFFIPNPSTIRNLCTDTTVLVKRSLRYTLGNW